MGIIGSIYHRVGHTYFEFQARRHSYDDLARQLTRGGQQIEKRLATLPDKEKNRKVLNHIIGIERWGQSRLKVALGSPFIRDEYNGYRPPREASWSALKEDFHSTRQTTLELLPQLKQVDYQLTILHNGYGELSVRGWLEYLNIHANAEAEKMR